MVQITARGQSIHGKSIYHNTALSSEDMTKIDNSINIKLHETYKQSVNQNHIRGRSNNFFNILSKYAKYKWILWICIGCLTISLLMLANYSYKKFINQNYGDMEIQLMIGTNNDTAKETRYQNVLVDTVDIYIDQKNDDFDKVGLEEDDNSSGRNTAFVSEQCSNIPEILRFDCHPEDGASQLSCTNRGCCWNPPKNKKMKRMKHVPLNIPYCYYPENWDLYTYDNYSRDDSSFFGFLRQEKKSAYKNDIPLVKIEATNINSSILRVKIYDPLNERYEPPWPIKPEPFSGQTVSTIVKYRFSSDGVRPGFKIDRVSDGTTLFNSIGIGGFIFANQFLQISTLLPASNIYGIGEHRSSLKLNTKWQSFTLFNKDQPPTENANLYGSHPFYIVVEDSGMAHGVLFLNSNAMDVILQPTPALTFRTIGGIFDMYFFLGPTPADVVRQYSEIVGKPFMPPYWSLGFHLCRYGYGNLKKTKEVWSRTRAAGIPFDTQWNDLDYMDKNNDFTYNKNTFKDLPKFVEEIHSVGMHYIPLIDAGISASEDNGSYLPYDEGLKQDVFVKDGISNKPFVGKVWNLVSTVWPDFTNPKTIDYYTNMMSNMHDSFAYDGAWIDMNEPSNFYNGHKNGCLHTNLDYPEYLPNVVGSLLATKTLCMDAKYHLGSHYDLHNIYGTSQAIAVNYALTKIRQKRPFIISRSTWVGHGHYAGHWTGDVYSSWHDMKMSISAILSLNFYQIPMVGADICGFDGNTTVALCNRWMQLGAFYPFSRNHNSDSTIEQDPVAMGKLVVESSKNALEIRYWLLPYLYTLFFRAHKFGDTVVRPLFLEFPYDRQTHDVDTQFLWGRSLMINPVLEEDVNNITVYIPRDLWYDYYTGVSFFSIGKHFTFPVTLTEIPLLVRSGAILPMQKPGATTTASRKNNFTLLVALDVVDYAEGELYWDDGESTNSMENNEHLWLSFHANHSHTTVIWSTKMDTGTVKDEMILDSVVILGMNRTCIPYVNGEKVSFSYKVRPANIVKIFDFQVDMRKPFLIYFDCIFLGH